MDVVFRVHGSGLVYSRSIYNGNDATSSSNSGYTAKEQYACVISYAGTIMSTDLVFNRNEEFAFQNLEVERACPDSIRDVSACRSKRDGPFGCHTIARNKLQGQWIDECPTQDRTITSNVKKQVPPTYIQSNLLK